jgi:hypothetical protein
MRRKSQYLYTKLVPAAGPKGRLRMARTGTRLRFLATEGGNYREIQSIDIGSALYTLTPKGAMRYRIEVDDLNAFEIVRLRLFTLILPAEFREIFWALASAPLSARGWRKVLVAASTATTSTCALGSLRRRHFARGTDGFGAVNY